MQFIIDEGELLTVGVDGFVRVSFFTHLIILNNDLKQI